VRALSIPVSPAFRALIAGGALLLGLASAAAAQIEPIYRGTLLGGLGGSFLADGRHDPDHSALQASFGVLTDERTFTVIRVGRMDFGNDEILGGRSSAELEYANVAGELRALSRSYTWGLFVGIGGYRLTGDPVASVNRSETAVGAALGVEGDFDFTRHFGLAVEFAGHYVWFDEPDLYGFALVGLAIHF
jgi:hypothetical protein